MSAQVQSPPIHGALGGGVIVAIVAAVTVGALAGSMITQAIMDRDNAVPTAAGVVSWDAGKLEAMEGRQLAEQFRAEAGPVVSWDAGKLEAMEGRQLAEEIVFGAGS
jgi:hypothetical protein